MMFGETKPNIVEEPEKSALIERIEQLEREQKEHAHYINVIIGCLDKLTRYYHLLKKLKVGYRRNK